MNQHNNKERKTETIEKKGRNRNDSNAKMIKQETAFLPRQRQQLDENNRTSIRVTTYQEESKDIENEKS